jgi:hypothetical protein
MGIGNADDIDQKWNGEDRSAAANVSFGLQY